MNIYDEIQLWCVFLIIICSVIKKNHFMNIKIQWASSLEMVKPSDMTKQVFKGVTGTNGTLTKILY